MPKHTDYAPLDDHAIRPTLHTAVNIETVQTVTHNNRRNLGRYARRTLYSTGLVQHGPTAASEPPTAEDFYTVLDPYNDDVTMDNAQDLAHDPATIAGPSGITVVPKQKAKRYENSVCGLDVTSPHEVTHC